VRIDKYLQLSGIIPRRSQAQEACDRGYVELNGRRAKPSASVGVGSRIQVQLGRRITTYEVLLLPVRPMPRARRSEAARLVESRVVDDEPA
jgi:ribosomal 50S subunit-recycling heat shock protein